jgi:hypothetical protein
MFTSDFTSSEQLLDRKALRKFSESEDAFRDWSERHTAVEVQQACTEIAAYQREQAQEIDDALAYERNTVQVQKDRQKAHLQAQLDFVAVHPEFICSAESAALLMNRVSTMLAAEAIPENERVATLELLEQAWKDLWSEHRVPEYMINSEVTNTPWSRFYSSEKVAELEANEAGELPTNEEVEKMLDEGKLTMDEFRDICNQKLAAEAEAAAQERGEEFRLPTDTDVAISLRPATPDSKSRKDDNRGFAAAMYSTNVDRRRG